MRTVVDRTRPQQQRAAAALLGAITGDAAAQTSHWNYNRTAWHEALHQAKRWETPEFFVRNSFYRVPPGGQSCYGDQLLEVSRHLASYKTTEDDSDGSTTTRSIPTTALTSVEGRRSLVDRFETTFGPEGHYGPWPPADADTKLSLPLAGPWRHASLKGFLTHLDEGRRSIPDCGADDAQADALAKTIPVVCAFAGHPELLNLVETAVRVTQNSDKAVRYARVAALVLEACILQPTTSVGGEADPDPDGGVVREALRLALASGRVDLDQDSTELLSLVLQVLEQESQDFEQAVDVLASLPAMEPVLGSSPVSLVA